MKNFVLFFVCIIYSNTTLAQKVFLCDSTEVSGTMVSECLIIYDFEVQRYDTSRLLQFYKDSSGIDVLLPLSSNKVKIIAQIDEHKVLNGQITYIDGGDTMMVGHLANGIPHGKFITYTDYDTTYFNYVNGKIEGELLSKGNDGSEVRINYVNNQAHGVAYWLFPNGRIEICATFFNGKRTGIAATFHDNGMMRSIVPYYEGLMMDGIYPIYDIDGSVLFNLEVKDHRGRFRHN
jgi:antitoxin component YwqK of YwqJK toxin-antitoxin module